MKRVLSPHSKRGDIAESAGAGQGVWRTDTKGLKFPCSRSAGGHLWLAGTLLRCYFQVVSIITAKQLHQETKAVLNQLEQGESLVITRNGRTIGRIEPLVAAEQPGWTDIMAEVWRAQKSVK